MLYPVTLHSLQGLHSDCLSSLADKSWLMSHGAFAGEVATGKNRQLASVDAEVAQDSMGAIPGIGDAVPAPPQASFPRHSGVKD